MRRRDALIHMAAGAAGVMLFPHTLAGTSTVRSDQLGDLAERIRAAPRDRVFDLVPGMIADGVDPSILLGATFLAGIQDVRPRPVGGNLHSVMVIEAGYRLVETAVTPMHAWLTALWALDAFKDTQKEESGDPWVLPAAPEVSFDGEDAARREFASAMEQWDADKADRAVVALVRYLDREAMFELLWPYSARCLAYIGHKIVYGAMTEAVLRRIDWQRHAEPTVRSLVYGLLGYRGDAPLTASYDNAVTKSSALPAGWLERDGEATGDTLALLSALLQSTPTKAQDATVAAIRDGMPAAAVWDAIRLGGSDLFLRRKSDDPESGEAIRAVHPVTELWSFGHAWDSTSRERTKRMLILQAAAWVPEMRDALIERDAIDMKRPGIAQLGVDVEPPPGLGAVFEASDPAAAASFLERNPAAAKRYLVHLDDAGADRTVEYHQFKYAVAIRDEAARAHPAWRSRILAPAMGYLPVGRERPTDLAFRSLDALERAGVP